MTMDCKEAKQKISEVLDGTIADQEALDAHLEECASCRSEYRELVEIQEGLAALAEVAIEPHQGEALTAAVMDQLGDAPPGDQDPLQDAMADVDNSGIRDLRELAALAGSQEAGDSMSDIFGLKTQDEAGPSVEIPAVVPPPVLMPVETSPRWLKPTLILGGVLFLAVVALAAVIFLKHGRRSRLERAGAGPAVASADQGQAAPEKAQTVESPENATETTAAASPHRPSMEPEAHGSTNTMGPETPGVPSALARRSSGTSAGKVNSNRRHNRRRGSGKMIRPSSSRPAARSRDVPDFTVHARHSASRHAVASNDPLAALLSRAGPSRPTARQKSNEILPPSLNRSQIRRVMSRANGAMKRCYERNKESGLLTVRVTVKGATGRISSLAVSGKFRGTATARCALKALRRLKFPKFAAPTQKFSYPYLLR